MEKDLGSAVEMVPVAGSRSSQLLVSRREFSAIVTGGSAGGADALESILMVLPEDFALPILVVQHLHSSDHGSFALHLARHTRLPVIEPCDKESIVRGRVYTAPANYHMLVERGDTISLSVDEPVRYSRPSIDVLFESASHVWGERVIAVILSGANDDGTHGMRAVQMAGGFTIAQEPASAQTPFMPQAAINAGVVGEVREPEEIGARLIELGMGNARVRNNTTGSPDSAN